MSPRPAVGEVSIASEGSPPWPPGRTTSEPNEGALPPPGFGPAAAPPTTSAAASNAAKYARGRIRTARLVPEMSNSQTQGGFTQPPRLGRRRDRNRTDGRTTRASLTVPRPARPRGRACPGDCPPLDPGFVP